MWLRLAISLLVICIAVGSSIATTTGKSTNGRASMIREEYVNGNKDGNGSLSAVSMASAYSPDCLLVASQVSPLVSCVDSSTGHLSWSSVISGDEILTISTADASYGRVGVLSKEKNSLFLSMVEPFVGIRWQVRLPSELEATQNLPVKIWQTIQSTYVLIGAEWYEVSMDKGVVTSQKTISALQVELPFATVQTSATGRELVAFLPHEKNSENGDISMVIDVIALPSGEVKQTLPLSHLAPSESITKITASAGSTTVGLSLTLTSGEVVQFPLAHTTSGDFSVITTTKPSNAVRLYGRTDKIQGVTQLATIDILPHKENAFTGVVTSEKSSENMSIKLEVPHAVFESIQLSGATFAMQSLPKDGGVSLTVFTSSSYTFTMSQKTPSSAFSFVWEANGAENNLRQAVVLSPPMVSEDVVNSALPSVGETIASAVTDALEIFRTLLKRQSAASLTAIDGADGNSWLVGISHLHQETEIAAGKVTFADLALSVVTLPTVPGAKSSQWFPRVPDEQLATEVIRSVRLTPASDLHHDSTILVVETTERTLLWTFHSTTAGDLHTRELIATLAQLPSTLGQLRTVTTHRMANEEFGRRIVCGVDLVYGQPSNPTAPVQVVTISADSDHPCQPTKNEFTHTVSGGTMGGLSIYKLSSIATCPTAKDISSAFSNTAAFCRMGYPTASMSLQAENEKIVRVLYGDSNDNYVRAQALGDSNVLLKYTNPHLLVVLSVSPDDSASKESLSNGQFSLPDSKMFVTLVDAVSGRILHRIVHENAATPVSGVVVDNSIVVSYWNPKAKRSEVSSIGLYDGFIGRYDFAGMRRRPESIGNGLEKASVEVNIHGTVTETVDGRSDFATTVPLVMQKTFTSPRPITHLSTTTTTRGITNRQVIFSFDSGAVSSIDLRFLHPRRPQGEPTAAEKEEGLARYHPLLHFPPTSIVTGSTLHAGTSGALRTLSAASPLESQSLLVSYGQGVPLFVSRITPAQGFDTLAEDFNHGMLLALLAFLLIAVGMLRKSTARATLDRLWA